MEMIRKNLNNTINMSLFNITKSNTIVDGFITTFFLCAVSFVMKFWSDINYEDMFNYSSCFFSKKRVVFLTGNVSHVIGGYHSHPVITSNFGDRFKALWSMISTMENNDIYEITENNDFDESSKNDLFFVSQKQEFIINRELKIYAKTIITKRKTEGKSKSDKSEEITTDIISIEIFSFVSSLQEIKNFLDDITQKYLEKVANNRQYKQFVYTLENVKYEDSTLQCWSECEFKTTRSFQNMFFDNKQEFIDKINFFVENEEWHYQKGIPYTLGIGLHGPPGTGKTSLIKCLAVALKRHIVNLNIKLIKTRKQLYEFYYENRYNYENPKKSISFDKKIIIIEDIDCMGDIVAERTLKHQVLESTDNIQQMISIMKKNDETKMLLPTFINDDPVTLDDILNLWDGIRETPGRVLVITSNHYDKLDKALKRPGRIDISLELSYASHQVISDMYFHFFGKKIDDRLQQIKPHFYTPSEITNIYRSSRLDEEFIARLLKNEKVE